MLALVFVSALLGDETATRLVTRRWQTNEGLPHNSANAVLQSYNGYLWVATYGGLARFDRHRFRIFNRESTPQLPNDRITALFEDRDGVLWVGTETGELFRFIGQAFDSVTRPANWTPTKIAWIASDETGDVWVVDRNGALFRVRDGTLLPLPVTGDPTRIANGLIKEAGSGRLWALRTGVLGQIVNGT